MDSLLVSRAPLPKSANSGPTLVFHTYLTVPIVSNALHNLYQWVQSRLDEPISNWIVLLEPQEIDTLIWNCYTLPNCDVHIIPEHYYSIYACEKITWYIEQFPEPGKIVLIAKSGDFSPLWQHRINGWKIVLVHPPGLCWGLQQLAQEHLVLPVSLGPSGYEEMNGLLATRRASPEFSIVFSKTSTPPDTKELDPPLGNFGISASIKSTVASGDAPLSSFVNFLQHTVPTTIAERNLTGIFEDMQNCGRRPLVYPRVKSFQVLGEPIKPRVSGLLEDREGDGQRREEFKKKAVKFALHYSQMEEKDYDRQRS